MTFFIIPSKFLVSHPCFRPSHYKVTTTTAQFIFYELLHFITAEILISYMLKYAMSCVGRCFTASNVKTVHRVEVSPFPEVQVCVDVVKRLLHATVCNAQVK